MKYKLIEGLVFGLGLGLALLLVALVSYFAVPWDKAVAEQTAAISEGAMKSMWSAGKVTVVNHEKVTRGEDVSVLGLLKNDGADTARHFSVEVELYDRNNKFVDICRESFFSQIKPGEERHFKVTCGGCRNRPVAQHASYKVRVVEG